MKPEKVEKKDPVERFLALGVPSEDWVAVLWKAGYLTVESLAGEKAGKVLQQMIDIKKKYKTLIGDLQNPSQADVQAWIEAAEK